MRPVSDLFAASVRQSHLIAAAAELTFPGSTLGPISVPVEDGEVTIDRTAQNRRTGQLQIPWNVTADLGVDLRTLVLGGYANLRRGIRYGDGSTELVQLGRLRVESVSWNTLAGTASLELADRMAQIRDEPFTAPWSPRGMLPASAAFQIVADVFGNTIGYSAPYQPPEPIGDITFTGSRADALSSLEQSYGAETYFDANGDFVFAAKPRGTDPPVWTIDAGESGVLEDASENLDRTGIYNGVLVTGQATADQPPVSALAIYDVLSSPIRWAGPFGKVALLVESSAATSTDQALATAQSLLSLRLKQTRNLTLQAAPNPALEAGDTITIVFPDGREETHLVDATTISLSTGPQQIITRTQQSPPSGVLTGPAAWRELKGARLVGAA